MNQATLPASPPEQTNPRLLLASVAASFTTVLDQSTVNLAMDQLTTALNVPLSKVHVVISVQLLMLALSIPLSTWWRGRFGVKATYGVALLMIAIANLLAGTSTSIRELVFTRALHGIGTGLLLPTTLYLVVRAAPAHKRGSAAGLWVTGATTALLVGPVLGGIMVDGPGWQWVFWMSVPLALSAMIFGLRVIPARASFRIEREPFDRTGYLILAAFLVAMTLALDGVRIFGLPESASRGAAAAALLAGLILVAYTTLRPDGLFPRRLFLDRWFTLTIAVTILRSCILFGGVFFFPLFIQRYLNYSPRMTGFILLPSAVTTVLVTPVVGRLSDHMPPVRLLLAGFAIVTMMHGLLLIPGVAEMLPLLIAVKVTRIIGVCLLVAPAVKIAFTTLGEDLESAGASVVNLAQRISGAVTVAVMAHLMSMGVDREGYNLALQALLATSVAGLPVCLVMMLMKPTSKMVPIKPG